jgi:hypothetical protein
MMQSLVKNSWLWALCGSIEVIYALLNVFMQSADGSLRIRDHFARGAGALLGSLALTAGVCTVAASLWRFENRKSWILTPSGLALSALGLILMFWKGPLSFRTIALLIIVMAVSIAIHAFANATNVNHSPWGKWFHPLARAIAVGFAILSFGLAFRWIEPLPFQLQLWMGSYFAFSAIYLLAMGVPNSNSIGTRRQAPA